MIIAKRFDGCLHQWQYKTEGDSLYIDYNAWEKALNVGVSDPLFCTATDEDNRMVVETFGNYQSVLLVKSGNRFNNMSDMKLHA